MVIRHLQLNGLDAALGGIKFESGKALYIEDSTIENFTLDAVHLAPTAGGFVVLKNDTIVNNGDNGVLAQAGTANTRVLVEDSTIEGNGAAGIVAGKTGAAHSTLVDISGNTITDNTTGLSTIGISKAQINSYVIWQQCRRLQHHQRCADRHHFYDLTIRTPPAPRRVSYAPLRASGGTLRSLRRTRLSSLQERVRWLRSPPRP
ncbi:MAG: right-handed parallel beta-helix repeat-containing protein [Acidimicrobiales bacterium]